MNITKLLLLTIFYQFYNINAQTAKFNSLSSLTSLCIQMKPTANELRLCKNGQYLAGGAYLSNTRLTLLCNFCLPLISGNFFK